MLPLGLRVHFRTNVRGTLNPPILYNDCFLIADKNTDEPIGFAGLWYPLDIEVPELCWSLFLGNTGNGYATEATIAARQWVYENRPYTKLVSYIHPDNAASCAVAERLGAKLEGKITLYGVPRLLFVHPSPPSNIS